ncbi:MAG: cell division protein FtsQ/DivIB [Aequorivita sp.]
MKRSMEILRFLILLGLMAFLFSFTKKRNDKRKLTKIEVEFIDDNSPFISHNTVNKLLISSDEEVTDIGKEALVLKEMEQRLSKNPMVREAQVYITVDGTLGAKIEQRSPIGRVSASPDYYLDADGKQMPLSDVYSARVPLITGASEDDYDEITMLLLKITEDEFMKRSVVGLDIKKNGDIELELRKTSFKVLFGKPEHIDEKFQNFKAFYKKTKEDSTLSGYNMVNLKFDSQVIATKK